jgi:hypothetical protein
MPFVQTREKRFRSVPGEGGAERRGSPRLNPASKRHRLRPSKARRLPRRFQAHKREERLCAAFTPSAPVAAAVDQRLLALHGSQGHSRARRRGLECRAMVPADSFRQHLSSTDGHTGHRQAKTPLIALSKIAEPPLTCEARPSARSNRLSNVRPAL